MSSEQERDEGLKALERTNRIKSQSDRILTYKKKLGPEKTPKKFKCQYCGCTEIKHSRFTGKPIKFKTMAAVSQHESWCAENPHNRRKDKKNKKGNDKNMEEKEESKFSPAALKIQLVLKDVLDLTETLDLDKEQMIKLIEHKMVK